MPLVTLATLTARVREKADMVNSRFVTDSEIRTWLNEGWQEVTDLLIVAKNDLLLTSNAFTVTVDEYLLPSNFYKLRGVDDSDGNPLRPFNFEERGRYSSASSIEAPRYRLEASKLKFLPASAAPGSYRLWYYPTAVPLVNPTDTLDGVNGYESHAVLHAAIECLGKEESDTKRLEQQKAQVAGRIVTAAAVRDLGSPTCIVDVYANDYEDF